MSLVHSGYEVLPVEAAGAAFLRSEQGLARFGKASRVAQASRQLENTGSDYPTISKE